MFQVLLDGCDLLNACGVFRSECAIWDGNLSVVSTRRDGPQANPAQELSLQVLPMGQSGVRPMQVNRR